MVGRRDFVGTRVRPAIWIAVVASLVSVSALSVVTALNSEPKVFFVRASGDTTLSTFFADEPMGRDDTLWLTAADGELNWSLVSFNLAGQLRPGDLIREARVQFHVVTSQGTAFPATIVTGRLLKSFSEASTTWDTKPLMGFDTRTATIVKAPPEPGAGIWIDVSKQLHRWHSYGGPSNFGTVLQLITDSALQLNGTAGASLGLASRENVDYQMPRIQISYAPGPPSLYGYLVESGIADLAMARFE